MAYIYDLADTWNASGTTFTAIKMNVTDTASASGSLLMDLQVGGSSKFSVTKAGTTAFSGNLQIANNAVYIEGTAVGTIRVPGVGGYYGWTTNTVSTSLSTLDLFLARDAANTLGQRNGGNPQAFNLYNSYTDVSNYERGFMRWSSNVLQIGSDKLGTGYVARDLEFFTNGVARARITADGTFRALSGYIYNLTAVTGIWSSVSGSSYFGTENNHPISFRTNNVNRLTLDTVGSVQITTALTVATLPATPLVGMMARVTDATSPVVGMTVTGGGAAAALCWYNGTNWTVIGV
jgi:hypothetical protein